jgi:hypothetical protein
MNDDEILWRAELVKEWSRASRALDTAGTDPLSLKVGQQEFDLAGGFSGHKPRYTPAVAWRLSERAIRSHVVAALTDYVAALRAAINGPYVP